MSLIRDSYAQFRVRIYELAKFSIVGILAFPIVVGGANALRSVAHLGDLPSAGIAIIAATIFTYLGNKYWTFNYRKGSHLRRESVLFFIFNGVGLLIQLAFVSSARYGLGLTDTFSYNVANITGIIAASVFRLYSYRRWVFLAVVEPAAEQLEPDLQDLSRSGYPIGDLPPA